jgi:tryptophan synthase alpha subunit
MHTKIQEIKEQGFKPIVFIDSALAQFKDSKEVQKTARLLNIPIYTSSTEDQLLKIKKAYVLRYGGLSKSAEASIVKKGGKVVSGFL